MTLRKYIAIVFSTALFLLPSFALAAEVSVSPATKTVSVGDTVTVSVFVDSTADSINNAEGSLSYPDQLDVVSISTGGSIFSMWIQSPASDGNGTITFNGGLPSPGYQGSAGKLFSVTFRAKEAGSATLGLSNVAVRANDGLGTDVFTASHDGKIVVSTPVVPVSSPIAPKPTPAPVTEPTSAPVDKTVTITSPTNPTPEAWVSSSTAQIALQLPPKSTSIRLLASQKSTDLPTKTYKPVIEDKTISDLTDGVWYVSAQAQVAGKWGPVTTYTLNIDTKPPTLAVSSVTYDAQSRSVVIGGTATDTGSGVATYVPIIDGEVAGAETELDPAALAQGAVRMPLTLAPGVHTLAIRATDHAGNSTSSVAFTFTVPEVPVPVSAPTTYTLLSGSSGTVVVLLFLALIISLLLNVYLWIKLRTIRKRPTSGVAHMKEQAKEKLLDLKKDLRKQAKTYEKTTTKNATKEEIACAKKMHEHLADVEGYLDRKLKDINKRP